MHSSEVLSYAKKIRCLTCDGQSVADSDSVFSKQILNEVAVLFNQGLTEEEVTKSLKGQYGDALFYQNPLSDSALNCFMFIAFLLILGLAFKRLRLGRS